MRYFVLGLLLGFILIMPGPAQSADDMGYKLVGFKQSTKEAMKADESWKACGNYFAVAEITGGRLIHFTYKKESPSNLSTTFAFATMERVIISINEEVATPVVIILGNGQSAQFVLRMNVEDYKAGLPCLGKGIKV